MRRKQLFALLLTGVLAVGMTPAAAFAEEGAAIESMAAEEETTEEPAPTEEESPSVDEPDTQAPVEEPAKEPTQAPEEEPTEAPTETPAETQAPEEEQPDEAPAKEEATPSPAAQADGSVTMNGTAYASLEEAIAAAPETEADKEPVKIVISEDIEVSQTIDVAAKKNVMIAAAKNVKIKRAAGFAGDIFTVEGVLQLGKDSAEEADAALAIDGTAAEGTQVTGSLIHVSGGNFGLLDGVTLSGNTTSGNGGAILNENGNIFLMGGSITENQAPKGAGVYSNGPVVVQGTVSVTGNVIDDGLTQNNIMLTGSAGITVSDKLGETSQIGVTTEEIASGTQIVSVDETKGVTYAEAMAVIKYDTDAYTIDEMGVLKEKNPEATVTPTPTVVPVKLTGVSMEWTSATSAKIVCVSNKDGEYYAGWVTKGSKAPEFDLNKPGIEVQANRNFTVYLSDFDMDKEIVAYVRVKDKEGTISKKLQFNLKQSERPGMITPTATPSRDPIVPAVTASTVKGLENPLEFYPNRFYEFTVTGAGTNNNDPIKGDVRWIPLYWSTSSNPSDSQKHTTWKIGAQAGIKDAATYNLYIFFQRQEYDGSNWQTTDAIGSAVYQFKSKAITIASPTPTTDGESGTTGTGGYNGTGSYDGTDDDAQSQSGDDSTTGSTTSANAKTADESPVGTMSMLAAASLLAGGYVLVRRRKKSLR